MAGSPLDDARVLWTVFDSDGPVTENGPLRVEGRPGSLPVPANVELQQVEDREDAAVSPSRSGHVIAVVTDPFGVESVAIYRILKG